MREQEPLEPPVVLITGCSQGGIGHAMARAFAAERCKVVATGRSISSMSDLEQDPRFFLQELDISSDTSVQKAVANVVNKFGRVDILVNNAGVQCVGPLAEIPLSAMEQTFNTNVYAVSILNNRFRFHENDSSCCTSHGIEEKGKSCKCWKCCCYGPWTLGWCLYCIKSRSSCIDRYSQMMIRLELKLLGIDVINIVPGAIKSNIGNSAVTSYNKMPEWQLYKPYEKVLRERAHYSQGHKSTPSDVFAKEAVATILRKNPPAWFSSGHLSTASAIAYHLPLFIRDFILRKVMKC